MNKADELEFEKSFNGIQFLFIDEYSMIPASFFYQISHRFKQISKNNTSDFPCIKIIIFGDIGQLEPVKQKPI